MAKEKENKNVVEPTTVDNIREQLDSASKGNLELAKAAVEKLKKDHDENTQRQMMNRFEKSQYKIDSSLLKLRRERDVAQVQKEELTHIDRLSRLMMGFVVTEIVIEHGSHAEDTLFEREKVDEKNKTVTIKGTDGKEKTYKIGEEVAPVIDYVDYDELLKKIEENSRKKINEIDKVHDTYVKKLRAKYDEYWNHSWY